MNSYIARSLVIQQNQITEHDIEDEEVSDEDDDGEDVVLGEIGAVADLGGDFGSGQFHFLV